MRLPLLILIGLLPLVLQGQIAGKVTNELGEPLPFATVYVRNTTNGTVANAEGNYRLNAPKGKQEIVFQYIGYNPRIEKVQVSDKATVLNVQLEPSEMTFDEVVISSIDPAERIMRQVIAKRRYYKKKGANYACDVYIKGFYKLVATPKKNFGQEVGDMDGTLDSTGQGVVYLSESVSKVWSQDPPGRKKEVMVSSRVSGSENGFSLNRATLTDFNLYDERLEIEREILSPLADNAFNYYKFKHAGRFKNELGFMVEKIKVTPRRPADPTFSGFLYIVDEMWLLAGVDLALTGASIKQPALDTMRIQQQFVPLEDPQTWGLLTQVTSFKFGVFGFKIAGFFNSVFSNYDLNPVFDPKLFNKEVFKIEEKANERETDYWKEVRPVPLTEEEKTDYVKKDSLQVIRKSKAYLDSLDRKNNRFRLRNLVFGYDWDNSYKNTSFSYPGVLRWLQFNTVQGLVLDVQPSWNFQNDTRGTRNLSILGRLNYGFAEEKLRANVRISRRFESIRYRTLAIEGGTAAVQFNDLNPITPLTNTVSSLVFKNNFMKLYDKTYAKAEWTQVLTTGLSFRATSEWAQRKPLQNNSDYTWRTDRNREFTPNTPIPDQEPTADFPYPDIFTIEAQLVFRPKQTYSSYPKFRVYTSSGWPEFILNYRKALPVNQNSFADFDLLRFRIRQNSLSWGIAGYTSWNVGGGYFLRQNKLSFMDLHHPIGNRTIASQTDLYDRSFFLLPYYAFSTQKGYVEVHAQHHLEGWLLDKIPLLRRLNWKEVIGARLYYADQESRDPAYAGTLPYWEANIGFENIGIKAIRPLRMDFAFGFLGKDLYLTGVTFGFDL